MCPDTKIIWPVRTNGTNNAAEGVTGGNEMPTALSLS
jgi:hypothetical protein